LVLCLASRLLQRHGGQIRERNHTIGRYRCPNCRWSLTACSLEQRAPSLCGIPPSSTLACSTT
jgi:hypothetical protein